MNKNFENMFYHILMVIYIYIYKWNASNENRF